MPIYEYVCDACGREFEHFARSMTESGPMQCPSCKATNIQKKLSIFASAPGGPQTVTPSPGGCGRCGDPHGPCS